MMTCDVHLEGKTQRADVRAACARADLRSGALCAALLGATLGASPAFAQAEQDAAESRSAAFVPVEGGRGEQVPGGPLLVYAYAAILVLLVLYVARLGSLYAKNRSELDRVARAIERGRKS
jgi:hypothetical protein